VNRQRTFFALLCITAGVAAIVSLRMLGGMVQEALDTSYQQQNRGDISLKLPPMTDDKPEAQLAQGRAGWCAQACCQRLWFGGIFPQSGWPGEVEDLV
jgi:hypothetical protein